LHLQIARLLAIKLLPSLTGPRKDAIDVTGDKELVRRFYQRLNAGDLAVVDEVVSDAFVEHESVPGLEPTKAGLRQLFEMFHSGFENASIQVDDIISEGDKVFVLARMTGKYGGEFMGIPASGNHIDVSLCDFFRVDGGPLVEHWV
jgi:steroid delta-isomerase-like uncharacterized protein